MSRIVIDARELRTSTGRYIERLLFYAQRTKSEHEFTVLLKPKDMDGWEPTNEQFTKLACPHKEFSFDEQIGFLRQLNRLKADLVHFGMTQQPVRYKGKTVTTIHDLTTLRFVNPDKQPLVFKLKQRVYAYVVKRAAGKAAAILTPSEFVKSDLVDYAKIDPSKVTVTHESADFISDSPDPLPDLQNSKFIMYVGRPTPHKNLERLIEAFGLLKAQHPSLRLVLAGKKDANYRRIEEKVQKSGQKNILFTDFVTEGQLRWLYENCEAYVFPSLSEGFGLPGLEAMTHGAPVVSSNATCLPEVYGDAAHYFDPTNTQAMADAINEVLTDKQLRKSMIEKGIKHVQTFSWQRMAEQTMAVYDLALKS
jgi:glycosyltransferase involved in cell wall biosynthesis